MHIYAEPVLLLQLGESKESVRVCMFMSTLRRAQYTKSRKMLMILHIERPIPQLNLLHYTNYLKRE